MPFWDWMNYIVLHFGYLGVFLISLIGAMSIVFPVPYTLLIYALGGSHLYNLVLLAIAGGLGSAAGEFSGYVLGYYGRKVVSEEKQKNMDYMVRIFDHYGPFAVFLFALTPLPDDLLFIPLGIMRYNFIKAFIPCILGKTLMCYILVYSGGASFVLIQSLFGEAGWAGTLITVVLLVLLMIAMFKIDWEKVFVKYVAKGAEKS